jgi:hypothetical protein
VCVRKPSRGGTEPAPLGGGEQLRLSRVTKPLRNDTRFGATRLVVSQITMLDELACTLTSGCDLYGACCPLPHRYSDAKANRTVGRNSLTRPFRDTRRFPEVALTWLFPDPI